MLACLRMMAFAHIVQDQGILGGKPIIRGTRISVEFVLDLLSSGMAVDEVVREYPMLTVEMVREAVGYAASELKRSDIAFTRLPA